MKTTDAKTDALEAVLLFHWKTRGLGTQYWVFASSVEEARQKCGHTLMQAYY